MALGAPARRMPIPEDIRDFFSDLIGKPCSVSKAPAPDFLPADGDDAEPTGPDTTFVTGRYIDDNDRLVAACISDLKLATSAGAALAMIPAAAADDAVKSGKVEADMRDNYYEVVNILSRLLNSASLPRLRLDDLVDGVPDDVAELIAKARATRTYAVSIVGYSGGGVTLLGN